MTRSRWSTAPLRRLAECWDHLRIPMNAEERYRRQGEIPYWGANAIQGYVDAALVNDEVVLVGEDGAPFFDRDRPVAFHINEPIWPNNHIHVLKPRPGIDARWLAYALNDVDYSLHVAGSTRDKLTQRELMSISLNLPPGPEQQAVADYLDRETTQIDTLIEEQQRLIELLRERRSVVVSHALPHGAPRARLKWECLMQAGSTPDTNALEYWLDGADPDGVPFVSIADMSQRRWVSSTTKALSDEGMASKTMPLGPPGTLLLAMYASVGEVAILKIAATWNQAILGITPDSSRLDTKYLRYVLLDMRDDLLRDVRSNTQSNLNASQVGALWFPRPKLAEQQRVAGFLDRQLSKIDELIGETERFIELSRERRSALITAAVTGQIDVRGEVA